MSFLVWSSPKITAAYYSEWLVDASKDLEAGMASGQNAEYLMDIFEEINKIINRLKIIIQQLERYKQIQVKKVYWIEVTHVVFIQDRIERANTQPTEILTCNNVNHNNHNAERRSIQQMVIFQWICNMFKKIIN